MTVWSPAWMVMVRYRRAVLTNFRMDHPGGGLDPFRDGESGHDDGEVRFDEVALMVVDGSGLKVALGHPGCFLNPP